MKRNNEKNTDFIKNIDGDVVLSDEGSTYKIFNPNSVTMAGYKDGLKFYEETYDNIVDFCDEISNTLVTFKFSGFEMKDYIILHDYVKVLFFKNPITKVEIRVALCGFKPDLGDLKVIYNELIQEGIRYGIEIRIGELLHSQVHGQRRLRAYNSVLV